jgi:hypothetical protein
VEWHHSAALLEMWSDSRRLVIVDRNSRSHVMKILALALLLTACPHPIAVPKPIQHVVDCGEQAINGRGITIIADVNSCLTRDDSTACLMGLVNLGVGITEDVVLCIVRSRGSEYHAAVAGNPSDSLSAKAAKNAAQFIVDRQVTFAGP